MIGAMNMHQESLLFRPVKMKKYKNRLIILPIVVFWIIVLFCTINFSHLMDVGIFETLSKILRL